MSPGISVGQGQEYRLFSPDLSVALVEPSGSGEHGEDPEGAVPLSEGASEKTIYLRDDAPLSPAPSEQIGYDEAVAERGYKPLVTSKPGYANVLEGAKFGGKIYFTGASLNLSHVVFGSQIMPPLIAGAEGNVQHLYEWSAGGPAGGLQVVNVLPDVSPYKGEEVSRALLGYGTALGEPSEDTSGAVSNDGSRVIWSYEGHLFMRDMLSQQTVQLDVPEGGVGNVLPGKARFEFASSDGSRVIFTDEERLTANSTAEPGKADLYVCEIAEVEEEDKGALKCDLGDLTASGGESAAVQGVVVPASDESSYVYFVANGVLAKEANAEGEKASPGQCGGNAPTTCNLYVRHYNEASKEWEAPVFIANLSSEDGPDWGSELGTVSSRISPDGQYLAFMSERSLTGYDNMDVNSGDPDEEVYLYGASSVARSGRLACVSCNPTGERPVGVLDGEESLVDTERIWRGRWLAATVPGWTAMKLRVARYQSRYVSDGGRVFFDSSDALVPQATNGLMDVFEYEPAGVGGCKSSDNSFSERLSGCVGLISSGSAGEESAFLDTSSSGDDMFFLTSAPLVSEDHDTAVDVYDAHVCSALEPCSTEQVQIPPCEAAESCRVAPSSQPSIFGAPASATFSGSGNPTSANLVPPPVLKCPKGKKLSHGKCVKIKGKHRKKTRAKVINHRRGRR